MDSLIKFPNVEKVLWEFAEEVKDRYRQNLLDNGHYATGNLSNPQNIECLVTYNNATYSVSLRLQDYWQSIEKGRPPTKNRGDGSLRRAILKWLEVKKILPTPNGKIEKLPIPKQLESLSYAISKSIHKYGTKSYRETKNGSEDLKHATEDVFREFEEKISKAVAADMDIALIEIFHR